jgi:hypothetical protein
MPFTVRTYQRFPVRVWLILVLLTLAGCGGPRIDLVTSGFHAPGETFGFGENRNGRFVLDKQEAVVIWANHAGAEHYLAGVLLRDGHTVVERARLQQIFDEQKVRLMYASDSEADVLHVGRLAGATQVIFVEAQREPRFGQGIKSASVNIRGVNVETGQVRWSGTARVMTTDLMRDAQEGFLAEMAMRRATCPVETDRFEWVESFPETHDVGCRKRRP